MIKQLKDSYCCVGLMSGTSLDGLDIVLCEFKMQDRQWNYTLLKQTTVAYSDNWRSSLKYAPDLNGRELMVLHRDYGRWVGQQVNLFLNGVDSEVNFIASHGHTVFHEPYIGLNFQLGDGNMITAITGIKTISDFRSLDVCLGGQGAPLVPIGDELLFGNYVACVNIGGFVNVSSKINGQRLAWDICPANFVVNRLVNKQGLEMDKDGEIGAQGKVIASLLNELNALSYYKDAAPKSLAQEWVEEFIWPLLNRYADCLVSDCIRTFYEHIAKVMADDLNPIVATGQILFTGGGVYNRFLMGLIRSKLNSEVVIPEPVLVDYKEALVFAFLGLMRFTGQINCLKSVTGASVDSSSGVISG